MRCDSLFLAGPAHHRPARPRGRRAHGRYDASDLAADEYVSVTVATGEAPPEMAAAAREALRRAGTPPSDVALPLHASAWF